MYLVWGTGEGGVVGGEGTGEQQEEPPRMVSSRICWRKQRCDSDKWQCQLHLNWSAKSLTILQVLWKDVSDCSFASPHFHPCLPGREALQGNRLLSRVQNKLKAVTNFKLNKSSHHLFAIILMLDDEVSRWWPRGFTSNLKSPHLSQLQ